MQRAHAGLLMAILGITDLRENKFGFSALLAEQARKTQQMWWFYA